MKSGGQIPWHAIAICKLSKTSWQTGNLKMNEDLENHSKDQLYNLAHWLEYLPNSERERQSENSSIWKESITRNLPRICSDRGVNLGERYSDCWSWRIGKVGCINLNFRRLNAKEVLITQKDVEFVFPVTDGSAKLSVRDYEFQEPTLRRESTVRRENLSVES